MQFELFRNTPDSLRILRLNEADAKQNSDHLVAFKKLIVSNEHMYPGIDKWLNAKVIPGIKSSERVAYVGYKDDVPMMSAVVKKGKNAKFCHLRINEELRDSHLGEAFFAMMTLDVRHIAKDIHFTLPSSLWEEKKGFFNSFGFKDVVEAGTQYRMWDKELRCDAPFSLVLNAAIDKMSLLRENFLIDDYSLDNALVISIHPKHAENIMNTRKTVEVRKKFSKKWVDHRVVIYATAPVNALLGEATIKNVTSGEPSSIWNLHKNYLGCTEEEFQDYSKSSSEVFAIEFGDVTPYRSSIPVSQLGSLLGQDTELRPPQSYLSLENNDPWLRAVSVASLLHGKSRIHSRLH